MKKGIITTLLAISAVSASAIAITLSMDNVRLPINGADGSKTFAFNGSTPIGEDDHLEDGDYGLVSYRQVTDSSKGNYIQVDGDYLGTGSQTMDFGNPLHYVYGSAKDNSVGCWISMDFEIIGITELSFDITAGDSIAYGFSFYVQIVDSSDDILATTSEFGQKTLEVASGNSKKATVYLYGYLSFAITSLSFTYDCVGN